MKTNEEKTLNELCRELQVSRRAVQGYEQHGLVKATGKTARGYLLYDAAAQEQIRRIRQYQRYGFQLKEIRSLLDAPPREKRSLLTEKLTELLERQVALSEVICLLTEEISRITNSEPAEEKGNT